LSSQDTIHPETAQTPSAALPDVSAPLRVVFAGTPDFSVPALRLLFESHHQVVAVYCQPDRPSGRGRKLTAGPVKSFAEEHELPVEQPLSLKDPEVFATLGSYQPDVMVVVAYGLLLPDEVLKLPRLGCLNIHASLLPRWRGAAPLQRAIEAGDSESGVTIMLMEEGLDTGPMLGSVTVPISPDMTAGDLHDEAAAAGAKALLKTLDLWATGQIDPERQNDATANYAKKLTKSEAEIDWNCDAQKVHRMVMAFNPWPIAQSLYQGKMMRIWQSCLLDVDSTESAVNLPDRTETLPGQVFVSQNRLFICCGVGWLELLQVQLPGKQRMPVVEFLKGNSPHGDVLGAST